MIRINLLPVKKTRKREAGVRQLVYMGAALGVTLAVIAFAHIQITGDVDTLTRQNAVISTEIERFKQEMGDYDKIKGQREDLLKQQKTIQSLQSGRTGPVFVLRELSEILTPGKGPTFDRLTYEESLRRDPNAGFNSTWDTRRVWIESYEEDAKKVKIKGGAKSNEDVAELLKRLQSSVFFSDVVPEGTSQVAGTTANAVKHVSFALTTGVIY